ncbi:MAG: hypothetical protein LIO96_03010 [Lachnospiraceae bacterium]|nr:hypothetical protein [Lachnospiraceae bacterium]
MKKEFFETYKNVYKPSEQVEGMSFTELAEKRGGRIPPEELFDLIESLFDVLTAAHEAGLIHGDICPENLVLEAEKVCLLNFGRAREEREKRKNFLLF